MSRTEPPPGLSRAFRHTSARAREAHIARAKRGARDERRARSFPAAAAPFASMCDVVARKDAISTRRDEGIDAFATTTRMRAPHVFRGFASETTAVRTWRDAKRFADAGQGARTTVLTSREGARGAFIKADCDASSCTSATCINIDISISYLRFLCLILFALRRADVAVFSYAGP